MKNQNDLIISIVAVVLALIVVAVFWATKPEPAAQVAVSPVDDKKLETPTGNIIMSNGLPGAGQAGGGGGGGGLATAPGPAAGAPGAAPGAAGGRQRPSLATGG